MKNPAAFVGYKLNVTIVLFHSAPANPCNILTFTHGKLSVLDSSTESYNVTQQKCEVISGNFIAISSFTTFPNTEKEFENTTRSRVFLTNL